MSNLFSRYAAISDHGAPPLAMPVNADRLAVLRVLGNRHIAQVADPVVEPNAVDVIYLLRWPEAVDVQPCQAMSEVGASHDANDQITIFDASNTAFLPTAPPAPRKCAGSWLKVQQIAQSLLCEHWEG